MFFSLAFFHSFLSSSRLLVTLLELVVPPVEVDVEHHHGTSGQAAEQESGTNVNTFVSLLLLLLCGRANADTQVVKIKSNEKAMELRES